MIKRIDHIAIVAADLDSALGFWRDTLGLDLTRVEDVPDQQSQVAFLPTGESEVELVRPTTEDSGTAKFLAKDKLQQLFEVLLLAQECAVAGAVLEAV